VFESLTRVQVALVQVTGDPIAGLKTAAAEGKVDLFIAADVRQLDAARRADLTEPVSNADIAGRVPESYRDPDGHWFGLSLRPRVIAVARSRVPRKAFAYEDLADARWKGKVCTRPGQHTDNVMLVAAIVANKGAPAAEAWLRGVKSNLAGKPEGNGRDQVASVAAGRCDIALVDISDIGWLRSGQGGSQRQAAGNAVEIVMPDAGGRGAHAGISGMALIKDAPGINNAALLMDFLTSPPAQVLYAQDSFELPIRDDVKVTGVVGSLGMPKLDPQPLDGLVKQQDLAVDLIRRVGFDNGPGS